MLAKPSAGAAASGTIWKFDTLCEHLWVRVKRHAIHHGCIVLYTEDTWKATTRVHRVMEW